MKRKSKYSSRLGKLFFIIPIVIIGSLVVYAFVELNAPGTVIVTAETTAGVELHVEATIDGKTGQTPWTLSLPQGNYIVNYTSVQWYYPPVSRDVGLLPGNTVYAAVAYSPIQRIIQVTPLGFNETTVTALHGVTPVNFTNPSSSTVSLEGSLISRLVIAPGQTYGYIFPSAGTYEFAVANTNETIIIKVS
jgi:hypothetical protein